MSKFLGLISYGWWCVPGDVSIEVNPTKDISAHVTDGAELFAVLEPPGELTANVGEPTPLEAIFEPATELGAIVQKGDEVQATVVSRKALEAHLECKD